MGDITDPACRREERIDAGTLRVTRKSSFTQQVHTIDLPITEAEWAEYLSGRSLIQDVLPALTNPQREFLMTGTTQEEWTAAFPPEEQDDEDGWIEHDGSECPVHPDTIVQVQWGTGLVLPEARAKTDNWSWLYGGSRCDIVRYRIVHSAIEPQFTLLAGDPLAGFLTSIWSHVRVGDFEAARVVFDTMIQRVGIPYAVDPDVDKASEAKDVAMAMFAWRKADDGRRKNP